MTIEDEYFNTEFEMKESEIKKEAKRLGWDVNYLKNHWRKEARIVRIFDQMRTKDMLNKIEANKNGGN